jgi:drug/metabolite transporter (DMT)-like permease
MTPALRPLDRVATLVMLMLCASWGLNQITAKYALLDIPPLTQAALRSALCSVLFGAFALWRHPRLLMADGTLVGGVLSGVLFGAEFIVLFLGLQWTTASHAILFLYSAPLFVALGLRFVAPDERLTRLQWIGLVVSFAGVALALGVASVTPTQLLGDALSLLAGALWGATTLVIKGSRLKATKPEKVLLYQLVVSAFVIGAAAVFAGEHLPTRLSPLVALCFAYQVIWIVCVTFFLWFWLIGRYRAGELSAFTFLTPVFGVLASVVLMGDPLTPGFLVAVALVTAGILLVNWPVRKIA